MNIKQLIKEAHETAVEKGFYQCPEKNCISIKYHTNIIDPNVICNECNNTGITQNKNIGEMLMLIVTELSEALEAHKKGKFCTEESLIEYERCVHLLIDENTRDATKEFNESFELNIKNTFSDELADVFIRIFDFCGYVRINDFKPFEYMCQTKGNIGEHLFSITKQITGIKYNGVIDKGATASAMAESVWLLNIVCNENNIDIEKHIKLKMEYNKTREYKHGKRY